MQSFGTAQRIIRFSIFEADLANVELRKNGTKLKLQDQPFQILRLLLSRPGDLVSREEIQQALWPDGTFVDFEHGVNTAVKKLRETLGDDADSPRFIETVPRRGYRFIGEVSACPHVASSETTRSDTSVPTYPNVQVPHHGRNPLVLIALVLAGIGLLFWIQLRPKPGRYPNLPSALVSYPGDKAYPSLSPSGQQVAFSWDGGSGQTYSIYEKLVGSETHLRLTNAPNANDLDPVWSPDGREVAFARLSDDDAGIYIVSALGGAERKVLPTHWSSKAPFLLSGRIDWSPDGNHIVFSDRVNDTDPNSIFLLSLDTSAVQRITSSKSQTGDINPRFSPDGRMIAFVRDAMGANFLYVVSTQGGTERLVSDDSSSKDGLAWTADGQHLVVGGNWLSTVPLKGGPTENLTFGQNATEPSIRGSRIAYCNKWKSYNIVSRSLADIAHSPQSSPIIASTRIDAGPRISPDGTKLAFQSNRSGNFQIWISKTDGTVARQLTNMSGTWTGTPRWSPDGKFITFDSRDKGDADVFIVDANGGPPRAVVANPGSNEVVPSWSADGRWIYFASDRTSRWEVWKVAPGGGDPVQITKNGGFAPLESADGTKVFYAKGLGEAGLWQVPNEGGEESSVLEMPEAGYWGYFTPVRNGIYYLDTSHTPALKFFDFSTRSSTRVFDIENPARQTPGMTVSPDGKTVFYTQVGNARSEIDLIDNFP